MKIISYELSKKIFDLAKEKGIELPTAWNTEFINHRIDEKLGKIFDTLNLYSLDEILEILPDSILYEEMFYGLVLYKDTIKYEGYRSFNSEHKIKSISGDNLTESAGQLLEWVLRNYPEELKE